MEWVWVVRYGNYEPAEISNICMTHDLAQQIAEDKGYPWYAERWEVEKGKGAKVET